MAKVDKTKLSKIEWQILKEQRRYEKQQSALSKELVVPEVRSKRFDTAFVIGNGTSRTPIELHDLKPHGKIYACNAVYRTFDPDYLVAVDVKMILEINKSKYQHRHEVWTNPNKSYQNLLGFNYFQPSKGWSSGPTALWLASEHSYKRIFILGFDFKGLENGSKLNNLFADTMNYKKSSDSATFFGNWMRQTKNVVSTHSDIEFIRVIAPDNYIPEELNKFSNLKHITIEDFEKMFNFSQH
jgi:hypothetical protein